jgi:hypothetical protein
MTNFILQQQEVEPPHPILRPTPGGSLNYIPGENLTTDKQHLYLKSLAIYFYEFDGIVNFQSSLKSLGIFITIIDECIRPHQSDWLQR